MKPIIAVTMGDPAGIGPEITAKLFSHCSIYKKSLPVIIGDASVMKDAMKFGKSKLRLNPVERIEDAVDREYLVNILDMKMIRKGDYKKGKESAKAGKASFEYIKKAINLAMKGCIDGIVTAPINKHALHMAGIKFPGHTEMLGHFIKTKDFKMMLMGEKLKVVLVTIHTALKNVPGLLSTSKVLETIETAHNAMKYDFGIKKPGIAVLGLNPHAGEGGSFGDEEKKYIIPAIKKAVKKGIAADGPYPPDTIFQKIVNSGTHDIAVCMYHDQGLIPLKLLSFDTGVNVTLGLPIVRTSPDHGTAYDIAGKGTASDNSILTAYKAAITIAKNRS